MALTVPRAGSVVSSSRRPALTSCGRADSTETASGSPRMSITTLRLAPLVWPPRPPFSWKVGPPRPPRTVCPSIITIEGVAVRPCLVRIISAMRSIALAQTPDARHRRALAP